MPGIVLSIEGRKEGGREAGKEGNVSQMATNAMKAKYSEFGELATMNENFFH